MLDAAPTDIVNDATSQTKVIRIGGRTVDATGPFLHAVEHRKDIFFRTAGTADRSFTVLIALAKNGEGPDFNKNGIAVIDNDNIAIMIEGVGAQASGVNGASSRQMRAFDMICQMNWTKFANFLNKSDHYVGVAADVDDMKAKPDSGNFDNQVLLGLKKPEDRDFRDSFTQSIHAEGLYNMPATSRLGMINQIQMHPTVEVRDGIALAWDVRMNFDWDTSGRIDETDELMPEFDAQWKRTLSQRDETFEKVCDAAIGGYLEEGFAPLEIEGAQCHLDVHGKNHGFVFMKEWRGASAVFANRTELRENLSTMPDEELQSLWTAIKVLDQDFSRKERTIAMQHACNTVRSQLEPVWRVEAEDELQF